MRQLAIGMLCLFLGAPLVAAEDPGGFRGMPWGTPKDAVEKMAGPFSKDDGDEARTKEVDVNGVKMLVVLGFHANALYSGLYVNTSDHSAASDYLRDFDTMKALLVEKYGKPSADADVVKNPDGDKLGLDRVTQIRMAYREANAMWTVGKTSIFMHLSADHMKMQHVVAYFDTAVRAAVSEAQRAKAKSDL